MISRYSTLSWALHISDDQQWISSQALNAGFTPLLAHLINKSHKNRTDSIENQNLDYSGDYGETGWAILATQLQ